MIEPGYTGASVTRDTLRGWRVRAGDVNQDTLSSLPDLRTRSRDLVRNSPLGAGAAETTAAHVVGTGLTAKPSVMRELIGLGEPQTKAFEQLAQQRFALWAKSKNSSVEGTLNFYELQQLVCFSEFESGDVFALPVEKNRRNWPWRLAVQIIEADFCSNPDRRADSRTLMGGVELRADREPSRFWFSDRHPSQPGAIWKPVTAISEQSGRANVLHLVRRKRPGQVRGVPALAPAIEAIKQITRYSDAELAAAVNTAAYAMFIKMDPTAFRETFDQDAQAAYVSKAVEWDGGMQYGQAVNLLPGEEIENKAPTRPNANFDPFVKSITALIGQSLQIPQEVLLKQFQSSYSAARAALLEAWRTWRIRRDALVGLFCQPIYERWLDGEIASGAIAAPGYFADPVIRLAYQQCQWYGDAPGSIDPLQEARAIRERIDTGITNLEQEKLAYDGGDIETTQRQRQEEVRKWGGGPDGLEGGSND